MQERRESKRTPAALFIRFHLEDAANSNHESFSQDVSTDGVRLMAPFRLKPHANLEMKMDVPNNPDMTHVEGSVRWVGETPSQDENGNAVYAAGVVFTFIDRQDRTYLEEYLSHYRVKVLR